MFYVKLWSLSGAMLYSIDTDDYLGTSGVKYPLLKGINREFPITTTTEAPTTLPTTVPTTPTTTTTSTTETPTTAAPSSSSFLAASVLVYVVVGCLKYFM